MDKEMFSDVYTQLAHAVQTGIKMVIELERQGKVGTDTMLKHHRVGIDTMKSEHGALATLLIRKGLITEEEYFDIVIEFLTLEVLSYEQKLEQEFGVKIKLG